MPIDDLKGGIPLQAEARLKEIAGGRAPFNAPGQLGTFALAGAGGFDSLGLVTGIAAGFDVTGGSSGYVKPGTFREFHYFNQNWSDTLRRAVGRLRAEATALGANVVIGITLSHEPVELADDVRLIKYVLTGNAMRGSTGRAATGLVLSNLSAADHWTLVKSGSQPKGLCIASAAYIARMTRESVRVARSGAHQRARSLLKRRVSPSQVLPDLSEAVKGARNGMVAEIGAQGRGFGATGIVNLDIELDVRRPQTASKWLGSYESRYWLMTHAIATAISTAKRAEVEPRPVISLDGAPS